MYITKGKPIHIYMPSLISSQLVACWLIRQRRKIIIQCMISGNSLSSLEEEHNFHCEKDDFSPNISRLLVNPAVVIDWILTP